MSAIKPTGRPRGWPQIEALAESTVRNSNRFNPRPHHERDEALVMARAHAAHRLFMGASTDVRREIANLLARRMPSYLLFEPGMAKPMNDLADGLSDAEKERLAELRHALQDIASDFGLTIACSLDTLAQQ